MLTTMLAALLAICGFGTIIMAMIAALQLRGSLPGSPLKVCVLFGCAGLGIGLLGLAQTLRLSLAINATVVDIYRLLEAIDMKL